MPSEARPRVSWVLLVVLATALAIGAAASILVNPSNPPANPSGPSALVYLPGWMITAISAAILALFVAWFVVMRATGTSNPTLNRMAVTVLVVILLSVIFLYTAHSLGFFGPSGSGGPSTNRTPPPSGGQGGGQNLTGPGGFVSWAGIPAWLPIVILAAVALLAVAVAVPELRSFLEERRQRGDASSVLAAKEANRVRDALNRASVELDSGGDARTIILALYAALLARLLPIVLELDVSTPEEIRAEHLERLGVRPNAARTLTRLFEEARYSTHPMGREASLQAHAAVRAAIDDLDRRGFRA